MTSLPASNLNLKRRGQLFGGFYADIVIFDKNKIDDKSTFENPHQYAEGMSQVIVNPTVTAGFERLAQVLEKLRK